MAVNDTYTASPSLLFNTWFGYDRSIGSNLGDSPFGYPDAGIKVSVPAGPKSMNGVGVDGYFQFGSTWPGEYDRKDWRIREVVALQKGAHQLRFGGEVFRLITPEANTYQQTPGFSFDSALSGSNLSDFMLGAVSTFQQGAGVYYEYSGTEGDLFAQDDWRINPKLTLNMGVRWDPYFAYSDCQEPDRLLSSGTGIGTVSECPGRTRLRRRLRLPGGGHRGSTRQHRPAPRLRVPPRSEHGGSRRRRHVLHASQYRSD